jgi:hypothetical protein
VGCLALDDPPACAEDRGTGMASIERSLADQTVRGARSYEEACRHVRRAELRARALAGEARS